MCGLVGAAGNLLGKGRVDSFHQLLTVDALRGADSTGVAIVRRGVDEDSEVQRQVGAPYELMQSYPYDRMFKGITPKVIIGHNRYATTGKVSKANAHPFSIGSLIGAHNGTLTSQHALKDGNLFPVDSMALYSHIDKLGLEDALTKLGGAWALTWWDINTSRINFLRNKERPLYFTFTKENDAIYWASEAWMLYGVLGRNGVEHGDVKMMTEDIHFSYHVDQQGQLGDYKEVEAKSSYLGFTYQGPRNFGGNLPVTNVVQNNVSKLPPVQPESKGLLGKVVEFRPIAIFRDKDGNPYLNLLVEGHEEIVARLYMNKKDVLETYINKRMLGNLFSFTPYSTTGPQGFYKVAYSTIRLIKEYMDSFGKLMEKKEWEAKYGQCAMCGSNVNPDENIHRFTKNDEVICGECCKDTELVDLLNLK